MSPKTRDELNKFLSEASDKDLGRLFGEPQNFLEIVMGESPNPQQLAIAQAVFSGKYRKVAVSSCHASGKTWIGTRIALQFLCLFPNSKVVVTGPTFHQVKIIFFRQIVNAFKTKLQDKLPLIGVHNSDSQSMMIEFDKEWYAVGVTTSEHSSENFHGHHAENLLVIVDEASGVSREIFESIAGLLASGKGLLLMLSNPTQNSGVFYETYKRAEDEPFTKAMKISGYQTPNYFKNNVTSRSALKKLTKGEILALDTNGDHRFLSLAQGRDWVDNSSDREIAVRLEGEFCKQSSECLINIDLIEQSINKKYYKNKVSKVWNLDDNCLAMGVDVARFGSNATALVVRAGGVLLEIKKMHKKDHNQIAGMVIDMMKRYGIYEGNIHVDETGIGSGTVDVLKAQGVEVDAVNFASSPKTYNDKKKYLNMRAAMYYHVQYLFTKGYISITEKHYNKKLIKELVDELAEVQGDYASSGLLKIEDKHRTKERLRRSPDLADAFVLSFLKTLTFIT